MKACLIRGMNHNSFRSGEWAEIIGCVVHHQTGNPAFHIRFIDGIEDYCAIVDHAAEYEFKAGRTLSVSSIAEALRAGFQRGPSK